MQQLAVLMGARKGQLKDMQPGTQGSVRVKYEIPTRGLLGLRNAMLTATKGTAVLNTNFSRYGPNVGDILMRENGSLIAFETGQSTAYAIKSAQERGQLFIRPGDEVYDGQVIGVHQRPGDLKVNVCKAKALTNSESGACRASLPWPC